MSYDLDDRAASPDASADDPDASDLGPAASSSGLGSAVTSAAWPASASASGWRRARPRHVPRHRRAFHRFYREHFGLVWSMVRRYGVPAAQHEDAVQEVWLVAFRRLHTLEPDASAKAWLSTIARRVASRLRRTEQRRDRKIAALGVTCDRPHGLGRPDAVDEQDARRLLDALLGMLDDDQRDVLVLAQVHGLSGPEIAETLAIPLNTAYSRLRLARRRIDRFVAEAGTEEAQVIGALRRSEEPPPRAAMRVWLVLAPRLGLTGAGTGATAAAAAGVSSGALGGLAGVKAFAIAVAVGVVGLATTRVVVDARAAAKGEPTVIAAGAVDGTGPARTRDRAEPERTVADGPGRPVVAAPTSEPVASAAASLRVREASGRGRALSSRASVGPGVGPGVGPSASEAASASAAAASSASRLTAEAELLGRAQRALREGDAATALRLLEEHERRFPTGELGDERRGARVRALCGLGRGAQARAEAHALLRERPSSPVAAGVADVCS